MASVEFLQKRVSGKKAELEKLYKKLERIKKAEAGGWEENNPYMYGEYDLRVTTKDIANAEAALKKYEDQLAEAHDKEASRDIPAIQDFLDNWEVECIHFFEEEYEKYLVARKEYSAKDSELCDKWNYSRESFEERKAIQKEQRKLKEAFRNKWSHVLQFYHGSKNWHDTMISDIAKEKIRKYDSLIERVTEKVGAITDASDMSVSPKGELDGIIHGTDGSVKVWTIGAGGYNIQKFHYRCLLKKL